MVLLKGNGSPQKILITCVPKTGCSLDKLALELSLICRCNMCFGPLMRFGPGPKRIAKSAMHFGPDRNAWQSMLCILVRTHTHCNFKPCKGVHFGWMHTHSKHHHAFWSGHIRMAIQSHENGSTMGGRIRIANANRRFRQDTFAKWTVMHGTPEQFQLIYN